MVSTVCQDCPEVLMPLEVRSCSESLAAPFAVRTVLGWTVTRQRRAGQKRADICAQTKTRRQ